MNNKMIKIFIILVAVMMSSRLSFAFDDGDFQYWNTESASVNINDDWKFNIEEEFRFGDNASDFFYQHSDIGLSYSGLTDWLGVSFNYRAVLEEKSGDWTWENRPHINATLKTKISDMKLSNRSRLEFRIRDSKEDKPRYRNKTTLKLPAQWTRYNWQPYLADEVFVDFESTEITRNRLYTGFSGKLTKKVSGELYYLWQSDKSLPNWTNTNVVGTKLKISF